MSESCVPDRCHSFVFIPEIKCVFSRGERCSQASALSQTSSPRPGILELVESPQTPSSAQEAASVFNLCKCGNGKREAVMDKVKTYLTFRDVNGISWICLEQALWADMERGSD